MASHREPTDDQLLARTPAEPEAFALFYERHERSILGFFVRRTSSPEVAADLAAEVFAAALEGAHRHPPAPGMARAWLYGIARHKLADSLRRGRVDDQARRRLGTEPLVLTDEDLDRVAALEESLTLELIEQLPAAQREAILAHVVDERPYPEIASDLRCSEQVVRKRVSRGLAALREKLKESR